MYHLVYVSSAVKPFSEDDLKTLLETSRRNNSASGITGMLLYLGGNFIQVLEGDRTEVMKTHQRIAQDPRHRGLLTLLEGEVAARDFSEWSMGFKKVAASEAETLPGYNDFLRQEPASATRRSAALSLLDRFKQINR